MITAQRRSPTALLTIFSDLKMRAHVRDWTLYRQTWLFFTINLEDRDSNGPRREKICLFGGCDQLRLNSACSATEASYLIEILHVANAAIILAREQITKALIRV